MTPTGLMCCQTRINGLFCSQDLNYCRSLGPCPDNGNLILLTKLTESNKISLFDHRPKKQIRQNLCFFFFFRQPSSRTCQPCTPIHFHDVLWSQIPDCILCNTDNLCIQVNHIALQKFSKNFPSGSTVSRDSIHIFSLYPM